MSLRDFADRVVGTDDGSNGGPDESSGGSADGSNGGSDDTHVGIHGAVDLPDGEPVVVASGITVSLGGVEVLADADLTADSGELVGLVGPNGAGKTTLLRTLRATLSPDSGEVIVGGERLGELSARRASRLVGSVPQTTALSFDFTVEETVEMGRTPHVPRFGGLDEADRLAVREAMERTEVAAFAGRSITEVSGGERQRVLLARALAQSTPVLLLDEPTANLDVNHAVRTLELVRELVDGGKTAVAAIHDLNLAARYCDELVLLADGRVRAAGPPAEVLTAELLRETFGAETVVTEDGTTASPRVTALADRTERGAAVHVVGTGSPAAAACARLAAAGYAPSVGVVPEGDVAAATAADLGLEAVTVPAFSGVDATARDRAVDLARTADVVVVAGAVAEELRPAVDSGEPIVALDPDGPLTDPDGPLTDPDGPLADPVDRETTLAALPDAVAAVGPDGPS